MTLDEEHDAPTRGDVAALGGKVDDLAEVMSIRNKRLGHQLFALTTGIAVLLVVAAVTIGTLFYSLHQAHCTRAWATATSQRSNTLLPLSNDKNDKLDLFVEALATHNQNAIDLAFSTYVSAVKTYTAAQANNPLPPAPTFTC